MKVEIGQSVQCPPQSLDCFRFFTKAWSDFLFKSTAGQGRQHLDVSSCFSKANWSLLAVIYGGSMSANKNKHKSSSTLCRYLMYGNSLVHLGRKNHSSVLQSHRRA